MTPTIAERDYAFAKRFTCWSALAVAAALVVTWIAFNRPDWIANALCVAVVVCSFALLFGAVQMWIARRRY